MADKIRQRITIEEVDAGGFKITSQGRDPRKNKERAAETVEAAKEIAKELLDLTFENLDVKTDQPPVPPPDEPPRPARGRSGK